MIQRLEQFPYHELSIEERIMLAGDIWDSVVAEQESFPVPPEHRAEIGRRLALYDANPSESVTWDQFKVRIKAMREERLRKSG